MRVLAAIIAIAASLELRSVATDQQKNTHHRCYTRCLSTMKRKYLDTGKILEVSITHYVCRMWCWRKVHMPTWQALSAKRTGAFRDCFTYKNPDDCENQQDDEGLCRWSVDEEIQGVIVRGLNFCVPSFKSNSEATCVAVNHPLHRKWERRCREYLSEDLPECKNPGHDTAIDTKWQSAAASCEIPAPAPSDPTPAPTRSLQTSDPDPLDCRAPNTCKSTQVHFHLYNTVLMCHYVMRQQKRINYICPKMRNQGEWVGTWGIVF